MTKKIHPFWEKLFRLNHNYYSFISGIVISVSIELFVATFSGDSISSRWVVHICISLLTLISSMFWSFIAWELDALEDQVIRSGASSRLINKDEIWEGLVSKIYRKLVIFFLIAFLTVITGLSLLPIGLKVEANEPKSESNLQQNCDLSKESSRALYDLGNQYYGEESYSTAISNYTCAIYKNPSFLDARKQRSLAHYKNKNYTLAFVDFQSYLLLARNTSVDGELRNLTIPRY